ncbi:2-phospho-L-lactate guanylyltransferase [Nocardia cerradoensis]|uniref:2-phospho-L-lactate guanylyltransferase n=1 Tax=Nocardia cerradoensis TaxID=85688 RepID=UPI0005858542|nr:2-phospho-L-lactate guanylyltransferase [Nocardia cerradoensis]NKY45360.1 2-phospho-L-lactate guanylyltransferase [Nocardia cerradoensis]
MRPDAVHAVIAVKHLDRAKSRLADRLPAGERSRLVLAMLSDTVAATLAAGLGSVTVVTPDQRVATVVRELGAAVHPDPSTAASADTARSRPDSDGLNTALASAAAAVRERHGAVDLLALQADLPAVHADELRAMLAAAPVTGRSVIVDHTGRGTAALLVRAAGHTHAADSLAPAAMADVAALLPRFGADSARRHRESGAVELGGHWPGLRLDVDTAEDLDRALSLGVGTATAALLRDIGWPVGVHENLIRRCAAPSHVC